MVRIEYIVEGGVLAPEWLFIAMGILLVLGLLIIAVGMWIARSEFVVNTGIYAVIIAFVMSVASLIGTSYTDFTDEEAARVASEIGSVACVDVTETDVILMYKNVDEDLPFEYDKMSRDGKNYFVMEGKC